MTVEAEPITCNEPGHVPGCPGNAGGDHELLPVPDAWKAAPIFMSLDHRYRYQDIWHPGVSTIIDCLGASFDRASGWGAKQAAEAAVRLVNELPTLISTLGEDGARKALASKKNWTRDDAAQLGTDVHALADLIVNGKPLPATVTQRQTVRIEHYARWWERSGWTVRLSEAMVIRPAVTGEDGWGGTFDLLAYDADGKTVLADNKTGSLYHKAIIQMAGYGMAKLVQPAGAFQVYPMPLPDRYVILHVTEEGTREVEVNVGQRERMVFLACLEIYHWTQVAKGIKL